MRIGIDARKLHDFGIGTYIRNLLRHLARLDHTSEYVLLVPESDLGIAQQFGPTRVFVQVAAVSEICW